MTEAQESRRSFLAVFGVVDAAARLILLFVNLLLFALGQVAAVQRAVRARLLIDRGLTLFQTSSLACGQGAARTIVIVSMKGCPACELDQQFKERLFQRCQNMGIPVVYVLSTKTTQDARDLELRTMNRKVVRVDLVAFGITWTPSIAAIDQRGVIQVMFSGTVSPRDADSALVRLTSNTSDVAFYRRLSSDAIETALRQESKLQTVELSNQKLPLFSGAHSIVIPFMELPVRANYELKKDYLTLVRCSSADPTFVCQEALLMLNRMNFRRLVAVDLPVRSTSDTCVQCVLREFVAETCSDGIGTSVEY